ncbi:MAG: acetyl-CoA synthase subunit gamma [Candidatus Zixiibacteriota bacterium]|nr:MAG: acetyl-CoA synthase subunit gamma [candidate division Zixibacteria bacterium]
MSDSKKHDAESGTPPCCQPIVQPTDQASGSAGPRSTSSPESPWITGKIRTAVGKIPVVDTELRFADRFGSWKARWGIRRMGYRIVPGLYATGRPTEKSPVFVTANYKMSFDRLRSQLGRIDSWILVLDTKGINVWCAAGKGTFGTDEIVRRVELHGLREIVEHRRLILPQLGAPGVAAHKVKELSGFRVVYGPVRARDIPAFLAAGRKATPEMRRVTFTFSERVVLIPVDLVGSAKYAFLAAACFLLLSGLGPGIYSLDRVAAYGIISAVFLLAAAVAGAILPAALLPWLPGRPFSLKGAWAGLIPLLGITWLALQHPEIFRNWPTFAAWFCFIPAVTSFMGMNFTGSSTYTSLSGVRKEMRIAIPLQIVGAVSGLGLWMTGLFV